MTDLDERAERRGRILQATLRHVPFDGWTAKALATGAADEGLEAADLARLFPGGAAEALAAFEAWADAEMAAAVAAADLEGLRLPARVAVAVRARLEALAPHREAVRRAVGHYALPLNAGRAVAGLYRTVDAIWYAVGDRSADFSFYTKRATLAAVYAATTLAWLDDRSEGHRATWAFLDRRLADTGRIAGVRRAVETALARAPNPCRVVRAAGAGRRWAPPRPAPRSPGN